MAVLGYTCTQYPDTQLGIIFLPVLTFSAGTAIKFILGIDLAGCVLGWKFFDHAGHLGGALFGMWVRWRKAFQPAQLITFLFVISLQILGLFRRSWDLAETESHSREVARDSFEAVTVQRACSDALLSYFKKHSDAITNREPSDTMRIQKETMTE